MSAEKPKTVLTFEINGVSYWVGPIPGRKRPCLVRGNEYCCYPVASFSSQEDADAFSRWLEAGVKTSNLPRKESKL